MAAGCVAKQELAVGGRRCEPCTTVGHREHVGEVERIDCRRAGNGKRGCGSRIEERVDEAAGRRRLQSVLEPKRGRGGVGGGAVVGGRSKREYLRKRR